MPRRRRGNTLERWEVLIIKAMLQKGGYNDQDILAYFTRPTRSINHRAISEIRTEAKHKTARRATDEELDEFLATWPDFDTKTGLSLRGDAPAALNILHSFFRFACRHRFLAAWTARASLRNDGIRLSARHLRSSAAP